MAGNSPCCQECRSPWAQSRVGSQPSRDRTCPARARASKRLLKWLEVGPRNPKVWVGVGRASEYGPRWEDLLRIWAEPCQSHRVPPGEERGPEAVSRGWKEAYNASSSLRISSLYLPLLLEQPSSNAEGSCFWGFGPLLSPSIALLDPGSACHHLIPCSGLSLVPWPL